MILARLKKWFFPVEANPQSVPSTPEQVGAFYNNTTDKFLQVYGEIIQAFRTRRVEDYLDYTIRQAQLADGQKILDAGCGIGGPSAYFATHIQSDFTGITISDEQVRKAKDFIQTKTLRGTVQVQKGDYHQLDQQFLPDTFDRILFLESFGHSYDHTLVIEQAHQVLKPGGILYIKDLFRREAPNPEDGQRIDQIIREINRAYCYNVADLYVVLRTLRRLNFIILSVQTPDVPIESFEHLTISNNFQELFDIAKIISWENYVFPIDFYEIRAMKAPFDVNKEKHLYFLNQPAAAGYFAAS